MNNTIKLESSSLEETRGEFNPRAVAIKLGIDVPQKFGVVVVQEGGGNPKPAQRFKKEAFLYWAAGLKQKRSPVPLPPIALIKLLLRLRPHAPRRLSGLEHKPNAPKEEKSLQD